MPTRVTVTVTVMLSSAQPPALRDSCLPPVTCWQLSHCCSSPSGADSQTPSTASRPSLPSPAATSSSPARGWKSESEIMRENLENCSNVLEQIHRWRLTSF